MQFLVHHWLVGLQWWKLVRACDTVIGEFYTFLSLLTRLVVRLFCEFELGAPVIPMLLVIIKARVV